MIRSFKKLLNMYYDDGRDNDDVKIVAGLNLIAAVRNREYYRSKREKPMLQFWA